MPTSIASAPASRRACSSPASTPGRPPVTYGTNATPAPVAASAQRGLEVRHRTSPAPPAPCRGPCRRGPRGRRGPGCPPAAAGAAATDHVRRLQRRQDALRSRERLEPGQRVRVRRAHVLGEAGVLQVRVLGPDARVVQAGGDRVREGDLSVGVLQQVAERAVQDARLPLRDRRAVFAEVHAAAAGLDADQPDAGRADERGEHADRVAAAADDAVTTSGSAPCTAVYCARASSPITRCRSRTSHGNGCGPTTRSDDVVGVARRWPPSRAAPRSPPPSACGCPPSPAPPRRRAAACAATFGAWRCVSSSPMYTTQGSPSSARRSRSPRRAARRRSRR